MNKFDDIERNEDTDKNEILSRSIRCGKRTYFFDVKVSKQEKLYLTISESKRLYNKIDDTFSYEKHKLFLMKQDLKKFHFELAKIIEFIDSNPQFEDYEQIEDTDLDNE